jgi:phytanoyl-CoA hydroxylase
MTPSRTSSDPPSTTQQGLSKEQLATFERDGYLLIPDALSASVVFSLDDHPMTKFSTGEGEGIEHVGDDYFLTSGDKIRFFFEEGKPPFFHISTSSNNVHQMHSTLPAP